MPLHDVDGVVTAAELRETAALIADIQLADGNIPWIPGGHSDPWNMVEAAMALDVAGFHAEAEAAYQWLERNQRPDGGFFAYYQGDEVKDDNIDTNVTCYLANGVLHHYLSTGDDRFLRDFWPVVQRGIDFALDHQAESGEIVWSADPTKQIWKGALLTGCSSIHASLRCAILLADHLGDERPDWELSLGSLAHAVEHRREVFLDKDRWAMDWYYPILGGVLAGEAAWWRIVEGWPWFVVEGRGVRCVSDRPWVTAAETCELVLTLDALGERDKALELFSWVQFLRADDGGYWTGMNFDNHRFHAAGVVYPPEQPTWNLAAVVLAAHALTGTGLTAGFFRYDGLPSGLDRDDILADIRRSSR